MRLYTTTANDNLNLVLINEPIPIISPRDTRLDPSITAFIWNSEEEKIEEKRGAYRGVV